MKSLKEMIRGTVLETPARFVLRLIRRPTERQRRGRRDDKLIRKFLASYLRPDSRCVDVGTNQGSFLEMFCRHSPNGAHFAFEPIPHLYERLVKLYGPRGVTIHNCALSDREGFAQFNWVKNCEGWSGLQLQPYPIGDKAEVVKIDVSLRRMDDVIPKDTRIDLIKIDVEGAEMGVMLGAKQTIVRCQPAILFEHAWTHNENYGTRPEQVYRFLVQECGLRVFELNRSHALSQEEFQKIYDDSHRSNYGRYAQTNFLALR